MNRTSTHLMYLIPAFNEEEALGPLIAEIRRLSPQGEIVVVDDGSGDGTSRVAREASVTLLRLPVNVGIGGAVQTGLLYARRNGFQHIVRLDGDGQHDPGEVEKLLSLLENDEADLVIGSRFSDNSDGYRGTPGRLAGIRLLRGLNRLVTGQRIEDITSGFTAMNSTMIRYLSEHIPVDFPEPETIGLAARGGFRIREAPVRMRARMGGTSSIRWNHSIIYMFKVFLAILLTAGKKNLPETGD